MSPESDKLYGQVMGRVLAELREQRKLTQAEVAEAVGERQFTISRIESGQVPDAVLLRRLADALRVPPHRIYELCDQAMANVRSAAAATTQVSSPSWLDVVVAMVGAAALGGLVAFAVAAAVRAGSREEDEVD